MWGEDPHHRDPPSITPLPTAHLEGHLGKLVEDGDVEDQTAEEMLQHGGTDVPGGGV